MHLLHRPSGTRMVASLPPITPMPALHVCRYPVEEPPPPRRLIHLPRPALDPHAAGALAAEALFLPEHMLIDTWMVEPAGLEPGLATFWTVLPDVPLTVPKSERERRQFDQGWRVQTVVTPGETDSLFSPSDHAAVGWAVLARANIAETVGLLAWIACLLENRRRDPLVLELLVNVMAPPDPHRGRLLAAARGTQPVFDPKALRWIIAELVAAEPSDLLARALWRPAGSTGTDLLAAAWFPWLRSSRQATARDVLLAIWLLHDDFHGADAAFNDPDGILAGI